MSSLQYTIDSICASVTVECIYKIIEALLAEGSFSVQEIIPLIQSKDRSLDLNSANVIAKAALDDMMKSGLIRIEGDNVYSAN